MTQRLSRRLFVLRVATLGAAGAVLAACVPTQPGPVHGAPFAPGRMRTGLTDADPSDGVGFGRGGYRGGGNRIRTGLTDSDPSDGVGFGRGGYRGGGNRVRTGLTDSDPSDGAGFGRGGHRW